MYAMAERGNAPELITILSACLCPKPILCMARMARLLATGQARKADMPALSPDALACVRSRRVNCGQYSTSL